MKVLHVKLLALHMVCLTLTACCTTTSVVLVPDPSGKVGRVWVGNDAGAEQLTEANQLTTSSSTGSAPSKSKTLTNAEVSKRFAATLAHEPIPPAHFVFHFDTGASEIKAEDKPLLDQAKASILARQSCDTSIIGHSDSAGDSEQNKIVSSKRAQSVADALFALGGLDASCADIRYYGSSDPVVHTAEGVAEAQNRRVVIEIR